MTTESPKKAYGIPRGYPEFDDFLKASMEKNPSASPDTAFGTKQKDVLEDLAVPVEKGKDEPFSVSISYGPDDKDLRINPPYGLIGLAANTHDREELQKLLSYAEDRMLSFTKQGDYDTASLFLIRAKYIKGLLDGTVTVNGIPPR